MHFEVDIKAYKLIAGLRPLDNFGVEVNYADFGKARISSGIACVALVGVDCPDKSNVDAKSVSAFAVGFLDLPLIDLFGKVGLSRTDATLRTPGAPGFGGSDKSTDLAWGAGAQLHFTSLGIRAEYERFRIFDDRRLSSISLGFIYTFL